MGLDLIDHYPGASREALLLLILELTAESNEYAEALVEVTEDGCGVCVGVAGRALAGVRREAHRTELMSRPIGPLITP